MDNLHISLSLDTPKVTKNTICRTDDPHLLPHPSSVLLPGIISPPSEVTPTTSHSFRVSYTESIKEDALKNGQLVECLAVCNAICDRSHHPQNYSKRFRPTLLHAHLARGISEYPSQLSPAAPDISIRQSLHPQAPIEGQLLSLSTAEVGR